MVDTIFPQSPNRYLSKLLSSRKDGSLAYGSQNCIIILSHNENRMHPVMINEAHKERITSVAFSPESVDEGTQNTLLSSSEDGLVKLWNVDTLLPLAGHKSHWEHMGTASVKVMCAAWSQCNPKYVVSAGENDTLVQWDTVGNTTMSFYFSKLKPTVLECSFHDEKIVAVGSTSGMVYIVKLVKKGEIIHRLRGHDKEVQALSWCPYFPTFSNDKFGGCEVLKQFLLASSCQENEIYVWRGADGACETRIQLPKNALSKGGDQHGKWEPGINFIPIFWANPYVLYAGTKYGELIACDMKEILSGLSQNQDISEGKFNKKVAKCWSLIHSQHSNTIMNIAGSPGKNDIYDKVRSDLSHINNSMHDNATEDLIWTFGKDQKLIAVRGKNETLTTVFKFHSLNGHPFGAVVCPHDPNRIAMAGGDGKVRLWTAGKSSGNVRVFWQKIKDRVYSLDWHPTKEGILAYGTSEGRVGVIDIFSMKPPINLKTLHHGKVYRLSWGPPLVENDDGSSTEKKDYFLYSVGGNKLLLHDPNKINSNAVSPKNVSDIKFKKFTDLCWKPDFSLMALGCSSGDIYLLKPPKLEKVHLVSGSRKSIQALTWHPLTTTIDIGCSSFHSYFTFGSTDHESVIKVYSVCPDSKNKVEQVAALKGHSSYIQSVSWNPHVAGRLISAGADFSVRIWDVTSNTQLAKFITSQSVLPLFCIWSPLDPDVVVAGLAERVAFSWRISTTSSTRPILREQTLKKGKSLELGQLKNASDVYLLEEERSLKEDEAHREKSDLKVLSLAKPIESQKTKKGKKMFAKAWESDFDPFLNTYNLLTAEEDGINESDYIFSFLREDSEFLCFLNMEAESHQKSNNWTEFYQLSLWRGNLKEVIEEKVNTGHLDDFIVSLTPFVSPTLWKKACLSYSKTLAEKKCYAKAACYLMAVHQIHDAVDLLLNADLYLEAMCIARCRLSQRDPLFLDIVRKYAHWLTKTGSLLRASECLVFLKEYEDAAALLGKKNHPEYLSLAAIASKKVNKTKSECDYAFNALLLCLDDHNWELASRICRDHPNLKQLSILYSIHHELCRLHADDAVLETDLISHLSENAGVTADSTIYSALQYIYDRDFFYTEEEKLYVAIARELSLACCAVDKETTFTHLIRAMNSASKYVKKPDDASRNILYKLCSVLSVRDLLDEDGIFCCSDADLKPKVTSLRAFMCQGVAEELEMAYNNKNEDLSDKIDNLERSLMAVIDDALNKETFRYFESQIVITSSEKKISEMCQKRNNTMNDTMKVSSVAKSLQKDDVNSVADESSEKSNADTEENSTPYDDKIESEKMIITGCKKVVDDFEKSRIIAPNPAVIYCLLRRVSEMFTNQEYCLKDIVENKWKELQTPNQL